MSLSNFQTKLGCLDYPLYWLIQKIHPIVELSVFWIQLSNLNYVTICPIMDILLTKTNRASHNQRHESIKRLKEQSAHYYEMFPKIIIFKQRKTLAERMQNTSKANYSHTRSYGNTIWRQYFINLRRRPRKKVFLSDLTLTIPHWHCYDICSTY
jgi:hypothetical protein